ncbi:MULTISPECIES: DUF4334 domain-containing protein [unclassified Crossiella]|uniref:DUF4334 domain-containing protein n=1 Tax=unclassified Crossiella TaxID=2620835 RepID=UPI001FFF4001|nr:MULTISPECIES: DUF4334 domain-containing protein [unclassified Crossiella]MCK2243544.1 DUF4334 domain-containing protein [Crossiella sp. S99.2]MCK2257402.1 DUF4334 domain-containing protein [Crossiella sp. S99.1]
MTNVERAQVRFQELRDRKDKVTAAELDELWAELPTVSATEILGRWRGDEFVTGHPLNGQLAAAGWYGKEFHSLTDAKPLLCRDEHGELYSNIEAGKGEASLWNVEFRGEVTATMVYDGQPIFDHFKRVDQHTLLGVMNGKQVLAPTGDHFYFFLERA